MLQHIEKFLVEVASFNFQKCAATKRRYSYKEIEKKSRNLGASLRKKLKLNKGDVVSVLFPNVPEFPIAALGALRGGLICTTVNPIYTPGNNKPI